MKIQKEWVDFQVVDLVNDEIITITKEEFERVMDDKFVAMQLNSDGKPIVIWTEKYVCGIKYEIMLGDNPVFALRRNPEND